MFKKILLSFLGLNLLFMSVFVPVAHAQLPATWYNTEFGDWYLKVYDRDLSPADQIFGERYTAAQVQWVVYGLISFFLHLLSAGSSDVWVCAFKSTSKSEWNGCINEFWTAWATKFLDIIRGLVYTPVGNEGLAHNVKYPNPLLADLVGDKPMSGITELKRWGQNLHLVPEVQAQQEGFGFNKLEIVRSFWRFSRDATYSLIVIAAIVMAFMIMFRVKLSPQTVISVQSAIPKLIITLILITFSYAIAGFLVDLVYVVIGLVAAIVSNGTNFDWSDIYRFMTAPVGGVIVLLMIYAFLFTIATAFALMSPDSIFDIISLLGLSQIMVIIIVVVVLIVLFFAAFKAFWTLIKTLALFYVTVIFAPFYILAGLFVPSMGFGAWLRAAMGNLAVFPVVSTLMVFAWLFLEQSIQIALAGILNFGLVDEVFALIGLPVPPLAESWVPPLLNSGVVPGNINASIMLFTSLSLILMIPNAANLIKGFMSGRPFAAGTAIGSALAMGGGMAAYPITQITGAYSKGVQSGISEMVQSRVKEFSTRIRRS